MSDECDYQIELLKNLVKSLLTPNDMLLLLIMCGASRTHQPGIDLYKKNEEYRQIYTEVVEYLEGLE